LKETLSADQKIQQIPPSTVHEKLTATQSVKKFPAFHGTERFFTTYTRTYHCTVSWTRKMHFTSS